MEHYPTEDQRIIQSTNDNSPLTLSRHSPPQSRYTVRPVKSDHSRILPHNKMTAQQETAMEPYTTVGLLSHAPATQTTVVTTTTTTTTNFAPFVFKAPRHLNDRDPKQYPLASSPTPQSLKRFCFDVGGKPTCFREAEDPQQTLEEVRLAYRRRNIRLYGPRMINTVVGKALEYSG